MKLKKVVSLALAGVMAVSMLAGCGTNGKTEPTEDENGAVKAGYSAEFAKIADIDLDYVTFQDSTVDQAALKKAVDSCSDTQLYAALVNGNLGMGSGAIGWLQGAMAVSSETGLNCVDVFANEADLYKYVDADTSTAQTTANEVKFAFGPNAMMLNTLKNGAIFVVDGSMSIDAVLTQVNKLVKGLDKLKETGTSTTGDVVADYHYTVSVSVVNRVASSSTLMTADMDFVAVTVTRTGTLAE